MTNDWQYHAIKLISKLTCLLPYSWLLAMGRLLGRLYYRLAGRQRERAISQIHEGMKLTSTEARDIIFRSFIHIAQTFLEVLYLPVLNRENITKYVEIENRHYLDTAVAEGRGVAVLSAHVGNWEWLGAALAMYGYPVASITKRQPNDQVTRLLNEYREAAGITSFSRGTTELVAAAKALKKGMVLGFFSDQDGGHSGVFVEFFGKMASTPIGLAVFARKLALPVVPVFIFRKETGGHRIVVGQPFHISPSADEAADIYSFTVKTTNIIEETVRSRPEEWLWFQKRWNTKWEGEQA